MKIYGILLAVLLFVGGYIFGLVLSDSAMWNDSEPYSILDLNVSLTLENLQSMSSTEVHVGRDYTGQVCGIEGTFDRIKIRNEQDAEKCLRMFGEILNIPPEATYRIRTRAESTDCCYDSDYNFDQLYNGIPVKEGALCAVCMDVSDEGTLSLISGCYTQVEDLSTIPKLSAQDCRSLLKKKIDGKTIYECQLMIYSKEGKGTLCWMCRLDRVGPDDCGEVERYFVDANNGNIIDYRTYDRGWSEMQNCIFQLSRWLPWKPYIPEGEI